MITGDIEPTSGKIIINNHMKACQDSVLGYCPQYNLLFDNLTVLEHLEFFAKLKKNFDITEINEMLDIIELSDKRNEVAKNLSGGMKRKLSVAIAFIGGSKIVILDEPSSGKHSNYHLKLIQIKKYFIF